MKALILVAGLGSRFASSSGFETPKCLVKVGDRHVADFSLETAAKLKLDKIVMVIGHKGEMVQEIYGNSYKGIPIAYAYQPERLGLVDAMSCGRKDLEGDDFWLFLGDEIFIGTELSHLRKTFEEKKAYIVCGMIATTQIDLIRKNYTIDFDPETCQIRKLIEKPENPYNHFIGTGSCLFKNEVFEDFEKLPVDPRTGKKELVGIMQSCIEQGKLALCQELTAKFYVNVNTYQDYLDLEKHQNLYLKEMQQARPNAKSPLF